MNKKKPMSERQLRPIQIYVNQKFLDIVEELQAIRGKEGSRAGVIKGIVLEYHRIMTIVENNKPKKKK